MAALALHRQQPVNELAASLRCAFSGIVAGNIKPQGLEAIKQHGKFVLNGEPELMQEIDHLLRSFIAQKRMTASKDMSLAIL